MSTKAESRESKMAKALYSYYTEQITGIGEETSVRMVTNTNDNFYLDKNDHVTVIEVLDVIKTMEKANKPSNEITQFIEETIPRTPGIKNTPVDPTWPVLTYIEERCSDECGCSNCRPEFNPETKGKRGLINLIEALFPETKINEEQQGSLIEFHLSCSTSFLQHTKGDIDFEQMLMQLSYNAVKTSQHLDLDIIGKILNGIKPEQFTKACNPLITLQLIIRLTSISRGSLKELLGSHPNYLMAQELIESNTIETIELLDHDYKLLKNSLDNVNGLIKGLFD